MMMGTRFRNCICYRQKIVNDEPIDAFDTLKCHFHKALIHPCNNRMILADELSSLTS